MAPRKRAASKSKRRAAPADGPTSSAAASSTPSASAGANISPPAAKRPRLSRTTSSSSAAAPLPSQTQSQSWSPKESRSQSRRLSGRPHRSSPLPLPDSRSTDGEHALDPESNEDHAELHDVECDEEMDEDQDQDEDEDGIHPLDSDADSDDFYGDGSASGFINLGPLSGLFVDAPDRFSPLLATIQKPESPPAAQLTALDELATLLSMCQEDMLVSVPLKSLVLALIYILGGTPPSEESASQAPPLDPELLPERQVLAARCLTNLLDALPLASKIVVRQGGVAALLSNLRAMETIEIAEPTLQALEKISCDDAAAVVAEEGLVTLLQFLDFFDVHLQRTALATVANCCRSLAPNDFDRVSPAIPLLAQVVTSTDRRLQETACTAVVRILQSFRPHPTLLSQLVTPPLCAALETVLLPAKGKPTGLSVAIVADLVRSLTLACRAAPPVAQDLRASGVGETLRAILTGSRQAACPLDKMAVLQALSERPSEQIEVTLLLARELLPAGRVAATSESDQEAMVRLCTLLMPAVVEVYSSCATQTVRDLALAALLQVITWGNTEQLKRMLEPLTMANLLSSILAVETTPSSIQTTLQMVEELLTKLGDIYTPLFQRCGLFVPIQQWLSEPSSAPGGSTQRRTSGQRARRAKGSPLLTPAQTEIVARAKALDRLHVPGEASEALQRLQELATRLGDSEDVETMTEVLDDLFSLAEAPESLVPYEFSQTSLLDGLLVAVGANGPTKKLSLAQLHEAVSCSLKKHRKGASQLVQCLQDLLARTDALQINTLGGALSGEARALPGLELTSQMRLMLVPSDPEDVPHSCRGLVIGIHAVAPLSTVDEFLHSKLHIAEAFEARSAAGDGRQRLSSVLAALARRTEQEDGPSQESEREEATRALMEGLAEGAFDEMVADEDDDDDDEEGGRLWLDHDPAPPDETDEIPVPSGADSEAGDKSVTSAAPGEDASSAGPPADAEGNDGPRRSYARVAQDASEENDWHLVFNVGDREVNLDETVFGAVYKMMKDKNPAWSPDASFWTSPCPITFRKVKGAAPTADTEECTETNEHDLRVRWSGRMDKVLQLLYALYSLMSQHPSDPKELESLYVSKQLTAKLNRQLDEPLLAASNLLPDWVEGLAREGPFLFPFSTRYALLQETAFGAPRLVARWQAKVRSLGGDSSSATRAREEAFGYLGRLARQKVRIARDRILDSVVKICEAYASANSVLEVEYFDEVGTGLGPTLEFYTLASRAFARTDTGMWCTDGTDSEYVSAPHGLFPRPVPKEKKVSSTTHKRLELFRTLGTFVAKSLLDSRIIHLDLHPIFWALIREDPVGKTLGTLAQIDPVLASSLKKLSALPKDEVEALGMNFTLPGDDAFELVEGGKDKVVTGTNLDEYVTLVATAYVDNPVVQAFRGGFGKLINPRALRFFLPSELVDVFGSAPEDWSRATLASAVKPDHGLGFDSPTYQQLLGLMASFTPEERRVFLQWLTGSPKLPIGGFGALQPPLTVVKRPHEAPLTPDDYLPSVMTCVNYLKLPDYSSAKVLEQRVRKAMHEGNASFHLS